jgi:hypothetical protein
MTFSQQRRYHRRDRKAETGPECNRGEENNAPSHERIERFAGMILQSLGCDVRSCWR